MLNQFQIWSLPTYHNFRLYRNIIIVTTTRDIKTFISSTTTAYINSPIIRSCFSKSVSIEQVHVLHQHHRQQQQTRFRSQQRSSNILLNPSKVCAFGILASCNSNNHSRSTVFGTENPHQHNIGLSVQLSFRKYSSSVSRSSSFKEQKLISCSGKGENSLEESLHKSECNSLLGKNSFQLLGKNSVHFHCSKKYLRKSSRMGDTGKKRVCIVGSGNW